MVITKITSGLGNQMFQYAFGKSLSLQNKTVLKLDISNFSINQDRAFGLSNFNIKAEIASKEELIFFIKKSQNLLNFLSPLKKKVFIKERKVGFQPTIKNLSGENLYISGYWQSEKYFKDWEEEVRKDFQFNFERREIINNILNSIQYEEAVSIHIRRGDYVSDSKITKTHGVLPLEYYEKAIKYIVDIKPLAHFFIFSDDMAWVKDNLKLNYPHYYMENNSNIEDLFLMSKCKHHIIANSSYSWWGAWLNPNNEKMVLMPYNWFLNVKYNKLDIAPTEWIRIE